MATSPERFKALRCLVLCAGFAASSPVSLLATAATAAMSDGGGEVPQPVTQAATTPKGSTLAQPKTLTFEYLATEADGDDNPLIADNDNKQGKQAKKAKKAKKAKNAKQAKQAKNAKRGKVCEVYFQGPITTGAEFTVVSETRSETLIQIFEDESSFVAGESALQVIQYEPEAAGAIAPGAAVGSLTVTSAQASELTFQYTQTEITTTQTDYSVVSGTVDDDDRAYIVVSEYKGGKCKLGKRAKASKRGKSGKQCKQGEVILYNTAPGNGQVVSETNCETLVQIFDSGTLTSFTDVSTTYWASTYIYQLVAVDVVSGFPGGAFLPDQGLTQAHFAAIVSRAFNVTPVREVTSIRTISRDYWAYSDLQKAYAMGFIDDIAEGLDPDVSLTKLDVLVAIAKGLNYTEVASDQVTDLLSQFTDADSIPTEYRPYIAALAQQGILEGLLDSSTLDLNSVITRAETCGVVYQALNSLNVL
jgi:hypothetical protein